MSEVKTYDLSIIANRYAVAFINLAEKHDMFDKFDSDLAAVKQTIHENSNLKDFLEHPLIAQKDKTDIIDEIFANHVSVFTLNLIKLLIEKNRIFILSLICDHYRELLNKKRNISTAQVFTAIEIDESIKIKLKEKLERMFNKTINIEAIIDKEIIAGIVVKIHDKIIDGSIKTRLESMKKQLI